MSRGQMPRARYLAMYVCKYKVVVILVAVLASLQRQWPDGPPFLEDGYSIENICTHAMRKVVYR